MYVERTTTPCILIQGNPYCNMRLLLLVCSALLFLGIAELPIGYYTLLRFTTTIGAIYVFTHDYKGEPGPWTIAFGLIAVLFNPLFPIHLQSKEAWQFIDGITGLLFAVRAFQEK